MLPRENRLTTREGFARAVRGGRRAGSRNLVVHLALSRGPDTVGPVAVGFVVSRQVGGAVVRNRVRRRLRHLMRDRLAGLPLGSHVVVRALPGAATCSSSRLARDLDGCLRRLLPLRDVPR